MTKRNIVVTGGNSGIGLETIRQLYGDGNNIIFGSRKEKNNAEAIQSVKETYPQSKGTIKSFPLDLSKRASIEQFAKFVKAEFKTLEILLNNAGLLMDQRKLSQDGIEMTLAINHFGHFYLTYLLFPLIKEAKQSRIINVSSAAHDMTSLSPSQDLQAQKQFGTWSQYSKSKLANNLFTIGLTQRLSNYPNIKSFSLHPGVIATPIGTQMLMFRILRCLCCCIFSKPQQGSRTSLFLSRGEFDTLKGGQYYDSDTSIAEQNKLTKDQNEVDKLWRVSQKNYGVEFKI